MYAYFSGSIIHKDAMEVGMCAPENCIKKEPFQDIRGNLGCSLLQFELQ